jgi:hypothetical protein
MDVYSIVTVRIIEKLEAGTIPWHKPWAQHRSAGRLEGPRMPLPPPEQEPIYRSGLGHPETRYSR